MSELEIALRALVKALVLPPGGLLLLGFAGLLLARRRPRAGTAVTAVALVVLTLLSLPIVAGALVRMASGGVQPIDLAAARQGQAIVILGGGVRVGAPEYQGDTLGRLTLERVRYGARLARQTGLPVLVSGGVRGDRHTEAELMRDALQQEYGVRVRWIEPLSVNTHDNAQRSARVLRAAGVESIVLVVHAFDVPRAVREFERAGVKVEAAPTGIPGSGGELLPSLAPSAAALQQSYYALYELLAQRVRR